LENVGATTLAVTLIDARTGGIYAEVPALAAGVRRPLSVIVPAGRYRWRCTPLRGLASLSPAETVSGPGGKASRPVFVLSSTEINASVALYSHWIGGRLARLVSDTSLLDRDVSTDELDLAKTDWLTAHLDYERLGAAYGTFGDLDGAINGSQAGLAQGVADKHFTGFLRLEYGLWHGQTASTLQPIATQLVADTERLEHRFSGPKPASVAAADLPLRAHEILENTLQKVLTGRRDEGSHTELATLGADVAGTQEVISTLAQAIARRAPARLRRIHADLAAIAALATRLLAAGDTWPLPVGAREKVLSTVDGAIEELAPIPDLLPMPPSTAPT
jgi:high-affinity iron transporter